MRKLFFNNRSGITLVALVVTIIVLLILAGISLNLIAGSNGIMERATKAADMYDDAQLKESLELSNAEMLLDCLSEGDSIIDLYDYIMKRCEENADKTAETTNGKYWLDVDGRLCYAGNGIKGTVKLSKNDSGNPEIGDIDAPIMTYQVKYDANGGSGVPTDTNEYKKGETVNVNFGTIPTREKYVFLGWSKNANATTPEYTSAGNFTMETQNVTLYAVWTGVSGTGTSIMKENWYGDAVNYSANGCDNWKVFSNDDGYIYMIAGDWVDGSTLSIEGTIQTNGNYVYTTDNVNTTLINWMADTSKWTGFVNGTYADQATGGPTLAQLAVSVNGKLGTSYTADTVQDKTLNDALYTVSDKWWLASPGGSSGTYNEWLVDQFGNVSYSYRYSVGLSNISGIRPLVRLRSNTKMTWNGSSWDLSI